jgi:regulator of protease activity HflC (stomatin/prohibitin superfamily)
MDLPNQINLISGQPHMQMNDNLNNGLYSLSSIAIEEKTYHTCDGCVVLIFAIIFFPILFISIPLFTGLFNLMPNEAAVVTYCGKYKGTIRKPGYHWINPGAKIEIVSLRQRNHDGTKLTVNDKRGTPIEIDIVVVWRIVNPAAALFQVENYLNYISMQSEGALRQLAANFAYDKGEDENEVTLMNGHEQVNQFLVNELNERLKFSGILCDEARVTHLRYAQEISTSMLKRQQADALIAAKQKIVSGVTGIIKETLSELEEKISLTDENKAKLAGNMLVVLCSDNQTQPLMHLNQAS